MWHRFSRDRERDVLVDPIFYGRSVAVGGTGVARGFDTGIFFSDRQCGFHRHMDDSLLPKALVSPLLADCRGTLFHIESVVDRYTLAFLS